MLKQLKKFKRLILLSTLKPKAFLILFALIFSTFAFAAALTVKWIDGRIPLGNSNCTSSQTGFALGQDRTEDPHDVIFSDDGLQVFTVNTGMVAKFGHLQLNMNRLSTPFELQTVKTDNGSKDCNDIDAFDPGLLSGLVAGGGLNQSFEDINIVNNGKIFFFLDSAGRLGKFNLSRPFDFTSATFEKFFFCCDNTQDGAAFSRDGKKMFLLSSQGNTPNLRSYSLTGSFDISSPTQTSIVNLTTIGIENDAGDTERARDIEFNENGSAMFIMISTDNGGDDFSNSSIYQFSLEKNYDVSTATLVGRYKIDNFGSTQGGFGKPRGFSFSKDGMKLFIVQIMTGVGVDQINQFNLDCPFGVIQCVSDTSASIISQVELAKQNISLNVDTIFKRFEWIKRNRDNEELSSHNININYPNPLLKSLASKFEPSLKNNLPTFVSNTEKKEKKKSKWSSWSIAEISVGNYDETILEKPKDIYTKGLTLGSDRKIGDNKFFGLAVRYGNSESEIKKSVQEVDLESLTLNIYGVVPTSNTQYINAVLGLSALRFDNRYLGGLSGERNGKQVFGTINYRTKTAYSKFNITPTGKFTYGVTQLSEFTDFISNTIDGPTTDIRYKEDTFKSGEFAGGLLFEMDKYVSDRGTLQPMGGIQIIYDLTDDITYKYQNVGATAVNKEILSGKYSRQNLKTNIGFEAIHTNGFTVSTDYQRTIRLNDKSDAPLFTKERFIVKFSKSKEDDTQFAFDFDPLTNNFANLSYAKDIGNFNLKFNSNYSSINRISDYGANIELSGTF